MLFTAISDQANTSVSYAKIIQLCITKFPIVPIWHIAFLALHMFSQISFFWITQSKCLKIFNTLSIGPFTTSRGSKHYFMY